MDAPKCGTPRRQTFLHQSKCPHVQDYSALKEALLTKAMVMSALEDDAVEHYKKVRESARTFEKSYDSKLLNINRRYDSALRELNMSATREIVQVNVAEVVVEEAVVDLLSL